MRLLRRILHSRLIPDWTIRRRCRGLWLHFSLRDNLYYILKRDVFADETLSDIRDSLVWDIGCNVGIHTNHLANNGNKVAAVDISKKALALNQKSLVKNGLHHQTMLFHAAFATEHYHVILPQTAWQENKPVRSVNCGEPTMTWTDLEQIAGTPSYIKMDIEGGEYEFLNDPQFNRWIAENKIKFQCEIHNL